MSAQEVTVYTVLEQYMSLFEVQEAVDDVSLQREDLTTVTAIQLRIRNMFVEPIELRLREAKSGRGYTLEQRSEGGWDRWHGIDSFESQTAGVFGLFKLAVEKSGFDPDRLPKAVGGPESVTRSTQGGKTA